MELTKVVKSNVDRSIFRRLKKGFNSESQKLCWKHTIGKGLVGKYAKIIKNTNHAAA